MKLVQNHQLLKIKICIALTLSFGAQAYSSSTGSLFLHGVVKEKVLLELESQNLKGTSNFSQKILLSFENGEVQTHNLQAGKKLSLGLESQISSVSFEAL